MSNAHVGIGWLLWKRRRLAKTHSLMGFHLELENIACDDGFRSSTPSKSLDLFARVPLSERVSHVNASVTVSTYLPQGSIRSLESWILCLMMASIALLPELRVFGTKESSGGIHDKGQGPSLSATCLHSVLTCCSGATETTELVLRDFVPHGVPGAASSCHDPPLHLVTVVTVPHRLFTSACLRVYTPCSRPHS